MKIFKKTISAILCFALLWCSLSGLSFSAGAAGNNEINIFNCESILENKGVNLESLNAVLKNAFTSWSTSIDIQSLNIEEDDDTFGAIIQYCNLYFPENMIAVSGRGYNAATISEKRYFRSSGFQYCDGFEKEETQTKLYAVIDELLSGVKGNDDLSEVEKALVIHDRLAMHIAYDNDTYFRTDDGAHVDQNSYHGCGALLNNKGLCGAYSEAYMCLMNKVGIRTDVIKAKKMNHAWNITMIDNQPYYVDVTWDDGDGEVYRNNFLRSVEGFRETGHTIDESVDWVSVCGKPINDTTYDNYDWQNLKQGEEPTEPTEPASSETQPTEPTEPFSADTEPSEPITEAPEKTDIVKTSVSGIKNKIYTGKVLTQSITVRDGIKVLEKGADYTVAYKNNKNAGTAAVIIKGIADYTGEMIKTFKIKKAENPITVKAKAKTVKHTVLKKRSVTVSVLTVKNAEGAVNFAKASGNKKLTVNTKNGKITVKKGLKKGKYTVKIKVTAKGNRNFNILSRTVKVRVEVK